ncbi:hypothetical protein, conserved [Babesia bigemina]|uniref:Uncharacterized protein n=1 Tax=Babesia bigemina TaxID=5866 RepID=A0A061DBU6_BABBI|nr:hypothetical protein, conserved [Babesia bigemina]CDR95225.1 hypothetical protein, conserved [Babesia bigemina]|eukprot:XP_012767411.1 hypothetical protein, conserved [Babesia bigemina]
MYPPKNRVSTTGSATRASKTFAGSAAPSPSSSSASIMSSLKKATASKATPSKSSVPAKTAGNSAAKKSKVALTVLPAESEAACSAVEPIVELDPGNLDEHSVKQDQDTAANMELLNCQSFAIQECGRNSAASSDDYPDFTVQDPEPGSKTFLNTLKTLVDITGFRNGDVEPLSRATSGSVEGEGFSIVTPICDATYDLISSSSRFIRGTADDEDDEEPSGTAANDADKGTDASTAAPGKATSNSTWNLQGLSNWL